MFARLCCLPDHVCVIAARRADADDVDCFIRQQRGNVGIGTDAVPVGEFFRRVIVDVGYAQKIGVAGQLKQSVGVKIRNYAAADDAESQLFSVVCHKNIS